LKQLTKPINKQYIVNKINNVLIRKSNSEKQTKRREENPFIADFTKRGAKSPLENISNNIIKHNKTIQKYEENIVELKVKLNKTKASWYGKKIQEQRKLLEAFI